MEIAIVGLAFLATFAVIGFLGYLLVVEKDRNKERETELLHLVVCKHMVEYAQTTGMLKSTPESRVKIVALENSLALKATELERLDLQRRGVPVS